MNFRLLTPPPPPPLRHTSTHIYFFKTKNERKEKNTTKTNERTKAKILLKNLAKSSSWRLRFLFRISQRHEIFLCATKQIPQLLDHPTGSVYIARLTFLLFLYTKFFMFLRNCTWCGSESLVSCT